MTIRLYSTPQLFTLPPLEGYQRIKVKIKRAHTYKGWQRNSEIPRQVLENHANS